MKTRKLTSLLIAASVTFVAAAGLAQSTGGADAPGMPKVEIPTQPPDAAAATPSTEAVSKRLRFLLSGYEFFPTRKDLDEVAEAEVVAEHLRALATDEDARPSLRLRAVDALGYYDDAETVALLERLVEPEARPMKLLDPNAHRLDRSLQHHAITALARARGPKALDALEPFLKGDDLQLKLTTISALAKLGGEPGRERLAKLQASATNPLVLRALRRYLPR